MTVITTAPGAASDDIVPTLTTAGIRCTIYCKHRHFNLRLLTLWYIWLQADFRLALSQWETSLQSSAVSLWLGANLEWALWLHIYDKISIPVIYIRHTLDCYWCAAMIPLNMALTVNSCQGSEWGVSITLLKYNVIKAPLPLLLSSIRRTGTSSSWSLLLSHFVSIHPHHLCEYASFGLYLHPSIHSRPCWEGGDGIPWVSRALNMTRLVKMRYYIAVTLHAMASQITGNSIIKSLLRLTTMKHQFPITCSLRAHVAKTSIKHQSDSKV